MAIINTIQRLMAGFGAGPGPGTATGGYVTAAAVSLSGASAQTTSVTMGSQGYTNGLVRVKIYDGGGSNTTAALQVSVTDGTNTWIVWNVAAVTIANEAAGGLDYYIPVNVDLEIATVSIITTLAGTTTTASMDYEVCLNP